MKRDLSRWRATKHEWHSLTELLQADQIPSGIHSINYGNTYLDVFIDIIPGAPCFVFLHGNCPRADSFFLPIFSGFSVTSGLRMTSVIPSDPTLLLDDTLQLSWHAGTSSMNVQEIYAAIFKRVKELSQPSSVIYWGGSGGGFASLYYSSLMPDSIAFVWNPQTAVMQYSPDKVAHYIQVAFGLSDYTHLKEVTKKAGIQLDVLEDYFGRSTNRVIYLQNSGDSHVKDHLLPFLKSWDFNLSNLPGYCGLVHDRFFLAVKDFSEGHNPPPDTLIRKILAALANSDTTDFIEFAKKVEFHALNPDA